VVLVILGLTRRIADTPAEHGTRLDLVGTVLSAAGLGLIVYGILRAGTWGFVQPKAGAPQWLGLSPVIWLILAGGIVLRIFMWWENHQQARGGAVLVDPVILRNRTLRGGLISFLFQYLLQAGLFFSVPLFLSVALGLSAVATGVRLLPLSITLLLAAAGVPKVFPNASPRRVVQIGFISLFAGIVIMVAALDAGAGPEIVTWPMLLAGLGVGALASQLGSVTVSAVPDEQSGEVGGIQNTVTNLGASIGTALAGAVLIAALTSSFLTGVQNNPAVPKDLAAKAQVELAGGIPFLSDKDLKAALDKANVPAETADAIVTENANARIDGLRSSLSLLALIALIAMFTAHRIPARQPSGDTDASEDGPEIPAPDEEQPDTGLSGRVGHGVEHGGRRQDQDVVLVRGHLDAIGVPDPEPALGHFGDLRPVAFDLVFVVDDVALDVQVLAVLDLDDPSFAQWRDQGLLDDREPVPVWPFDLHAVLDVQHPFLDLDQLAPVHVLEHNGLADPQRLAVELVHALAALVFDLVVVADRDHALAHLVARGLLVKAPFLPSLPAEHCQRPHSLTQARGIRPVSAGRRKPASPAGERVQPPRSEDSGSACAGRSQGGCGRGNAPNGPERIGAGDFVTMKLRGQRYSDQ
jgi:hypothetical protein